MKLEKTILAFFAWLSLGILTWLFVLGVIELTPIPSVAWVFFGTVAIGASAGKGRDS